MNAEQYFREAEKAAAKAADLLGQEDGQAPAAVWAALAQAYATLALAAAERAITGRGGLRLFPAAPPAPARATPGPLPPGGPLPVTAGRPLPIAPQKPDPGSPVSHS